MEREIEIKITDENPNISQRFDDNLEIVARINVIDKATEELLWSRLKDGILLENYSLNKDMFLIFEELDFSSDYIIVTQRMTDFFKDNEEQLILTWFSNEKSLTTDSNTFIHNWEDFFSPSADDLVVVNKNLDWVIYIAHYEVFQLGQKLLAS